MKITGISVVLVKLDCFNEGYKNIQTTLKAATPPITMLDHRLYDIYDSWVATL